MQQEVFEGIASRKFRGYAVWEPILSTDDVRGARKATTILPDPRVRHYWIQGHGVGRLFQPALGLTESLAWDVYLVYPPGVEWSGNRPPKPSYYMHQLGELPASRRLKPATLATRVRSTITEGGD